MDEDKDTQVDGDTENADQGGDSSETEDTTSNATDDELAKARKIADDQRKRAEKAEAELKTLKGKKPETAANPEEIRKQAQEAARAELEARDLEELEHSDEIKEQVKKLAQLQGISVRKAAQDPYIKHLVEKETAAKRAAEAADNGARKGRKGGTQIDTSKPLDPQDFDLSTEEGRKEWEAAKKTHREARKG